MRPELILLIIAAVSLLILPSVAFVVGQRFGRNCPCCGWGMICNPCVTAKCPKVEHLR